MSRETISRHALNAMIDTRLQGMEVCRNLAVTITHDESRCTGPNWRVSILRRSGDDNDQVACNDAIQPFMRELADRYDVPEHPPTADEIRDWTKRISSKGCPADPKPDAVPPHVLDHLLDSKFVVIVDGRPERTARGDQVAAG